MKRIRAITRLIGIVLLVTMGTVETFHHHALPGVVSAPITGSRPAVACAPSTASEPTPCPACQLLNTATTPPVAPPALPPPPVFTGSVSLPCRAQVSKVSFSPSAPRAPPLWVSFA